MDRCLHPPALHGAQGCRLNGCPCASEFGAHTDPRVPAPMQPVQPQQGPLLMVPLATIGAITIIAIVVLLLSGQVCS